MQPWMSWRDSVCLIDCNLLHKGIVRAILVNTPDQSSSNNYSCGSNAEHKGVVNIHQKQFLLLQELLLFFAIQYQELYSGMNHT